MAITRSDLIAYLSTHWITDVAAVPAAVTAWVNSRTSTPTTTVATTASTSRSEAGLRAAATRSAARTWVSRDGKRYVVFSRDIGYGVRVPRTFVRDHLGAEPGDSVLVVGSKGITPTPLTVKSDGSLYIGKRLLSAFINRSFRFRADNGNLVVKA